MQGSTILARLLPPGAEGVCPVLGGGGGGREVCGEIPGCCCTMQLIIAGLGPRCPAADGMGVGTGTGPALTGVVAGLVARPLGAMLAFCYVAYRLSPTQRHSGSTSANSTPGIFTF